LFFGGETARAREVGVSRVAEGLVRPDVAVTPGKVSITVQSY
jgi:hypothetical protein